MVDATKRPLKLSSNFAVYADKHDIFELMMQLYQSLIVNRPEDPLSYLVNLLQCKDLDVFTVIILGPPSSGKHTLAELLCKVCPSLVLVDPIPIIRSYLRAESKKIPKHKRPPLPKRYRVPPNVAAHAINWYLTRSACDKSGWVIPGFPRNKNQAMELAVRGIFPQYVITLELRDVTICTRFTTKYPEFKEYFVNSNPYCKCGSINSSNNTSTNNPTSNNPTMSNVSTTNVLTNNSSLSNSLSNTATSTQSLNTTTDTNPNNNNSSSSNNMATSSNESPSLLSLPFGIKKFQRAITSFRRNLPELSSFYEKVRHEINAEMPIELLLKSTVEILETKPHSLTPYNPRILLLGPPASGKGTLAISLANKYDLVNLHCGELLRQRKARHALDSETELNIADARDEFVVSVVTDRLNKTDCVTSGWILRGFPRNPIQAILFRQANFFPNKVIFLNVPDEECLERVLPRRIDPITGFTYHSREKIPKEPAVIARLVVHPRDREELVRERLSRYRHHEESLVACYTQSQYIDGKGPIFSVFERLESVLLRPNPRRLHIPDDIFPSTEDKSLTQIETPPLINYHIQPLDIDFVDVEANCFVVF